MKKIFSILAIAFVSLSFVSCRQDDDTTTEMELNKTSQENLENKKSIDTIASDSAKVSSRPEMTLDPPKDPPRDTSSW
ncbi:hypothetical protein [Epilithonimonas hispanica]|uniref:Lipoprotein n=1 Tax=Epilithonimonas hispanica TaxID=358687 RepID=A0A3D9CTQ1_9FLAO|nr:hypothetical protein [Epilithonimonas hispanica]REC69156.1 hypothetical protein DRF58_12990 [Epilithonimonas hispanica]